MSLVARAGLASALVAGALISIAQPSHADVSLYTGSIITPDQSSGWFLRGFGQDVGISHAFFVPGTDPSGQYADPAIALHYGLNHFTIMGAGNPQPETQIGFSAVFASDFSKYIVLPFQDVGATSDSASISLDNGDIVVVSNFVFNYATPGSPSIYGSYDYSNNLPNFIASVDILVPEPASLGLFGTAMGILGMLRRNRRPD